MIQIWRIWARRTALFLGALALTALVLDRAFPPPIDRGLNVSAMVTDHEGRPLRAFPVEDGRWRLAADLEQIDPAFIEALIRIEDKRFYQHWGVDPVAIIRAITSAVRQGEITSGASTITMQTARLLEPRPRTISSKLIECFRAVQLEARLSKDEILELYLTLAPYGGNLEGTASAAFAYYGRSPQNLTPEELALLIALPQSPEARRPDLRPKTAQLTRNDILYRLAQEEYIEVSSAADASDEPVPSGRIAFPSQAWQSAETLKQYTHQKGYARTTIDWALQTETERLVRQAAIMAGDDVQIAALVVEIETRAVRAAVGSAGKDRAGGWLDLTARHRSPGSALKPFIYGMAFDDGIAASGTLINDLPSRFAGYRPENFDRTFRGEVTISDALQHSLNVPAVRVLDSVGAGRFLSALEYAGSAPQLPKSAESDVGLALALGGLGLTVQDVAVLYAALGDEGVTLPLAWTPPQSEENQNKNGYQILSSESALEILTILENAPPPPGRIPTILSETVPPVAYKTGTSYGFRDAWAAGVSDGYAIVVWTGYADGTPRPGITGRSAAAPLLFDLFDAARQALPLNHKGREFFSQESTPSPLSRFTPQATPPQILFPPDEAEIWSDETGRSFVLSARGTEPLTWYADGKPVSYDASGAPLWQPTGPGFYRLEVVDANGMSTASNVRVRGPKG